MTRFRLALPCALVLILSLVLAACGGDDETKSEPAAKEAGPAIEFEVVEKLTPPALAKDKECPPGKFEVTDEELLTTLPPEYVPKAETIQTYSCGGRVDQVVWVELKEEADAQKLLKEGGDNAPSLVAGKTAVLVNYGVEPKVKITEFFDSVKAECGCSAETTYTGGGS
jgi:hypothetical protein